MNDPVSRSLGLDRAAGGTPLTDRSDRGRAALQEETGALGATLPPRNRLLRALPRAEQDRMSPHLETLSLTSRDLLFDAEKPISHVYFPETVVVSLVSTLREGGTVEVGTVGREGMAGLPVFLANDVSSVRAIAQVPGMAQRLGADVFTELARAGSELHRLMLRYTQLFLTQVAQTAACNGAHVVERRCARWILMTRDRVDGDELEITQEFLAFMLGVRRAGVSVAVNALQSAGLIKTTRGRIRVVDRKALESASCECYGIVRAHHERVFGSAG